MTQFSNVEQAFLQKSGRHASYEMEKSPIVEVQNVYELGQLVAISFLEWVSANPNGVIALPTGRTPEYFIKTLDRYRAHWGSDALIQELKSVGFTPGDSFPITSGLTFVMLDEFFPMSTEHRNSFCNYIRNFYVGPLGISDDKVLDFDLVKKGVITSAEMQEFVSINVDLVLLTAAEAGLSPEQQRLRTILLKVQQYCDDYEAKIRSLGGIGFFIGGIGPDGHIAFNQQDQPLGSTTRLVNFNYPTAAAAAGDLGGIEKARGKAAMTIGLETITFKSDVKAIIMAAGEGKAEVVRRTIEDAPTPFNPGSSLQGIPGARFYLTHGAASKLSSRKAEDISHITNKCVAWALSHLSGVGVGLGIDQAHLVVPPEEYILAESLIYACAAKSGKPVHELLSVKELELLPEANSIPDWMKEPHNFSVLISCAARRVREKIDGGLRAASMMSKSILHTAPHHDDIMLSYHGAMHEMLGRQPAGSSSSYLTDTDPENQGLNQANALNLNSSNSSNPDRESREDVEKVKAKTADARKDRGASISLVAPLQLGERFNKNVNHFAYLTSGFHSVEDKMLLKLSKSVMNQAGQAGQGDQAITGFSGLPIPPSGKGHPGAADETILSRIVHQGELTRDYDELMAVFLDHFSRGEEEGKDHVEMCIFLRMVAVVWAIVPTQSYANLVTQLSERVNWLLNDYLPNQHPGDAVPVNMQLLKGCMRESEVDRVWALSKMPMNRIHHMRSKFYTDDFFCPMPSLEDDALPFANLCRSRQPDLLTVAFDPEGTGPDTHYKVLQVVAAGLRLSMNRGDLKNKNGPMVWGYRNVWFVFSPCEANIMIPCSEEDLDLMHDTFMSCFTTQKEASFPSPHYDGPFSAWAKHLQVEQKKQLVSLLGEEYFTNHADPRVRNASGFVFLRAMHAETFLKECEGLKSKFEMV